MRVTRSGSEGLRVGCVQYLNAQPLIYGWQGPVIFDHPSSLCRQLAAGELDVAEQDCDGPTTETERRLAAAWADVLGIPREQIGRRDQFFDLGGTSLSALKLLIKLERAVSFKDLTDHPILANLAALVDERSAQGLIAGPEKLPLP